MSTDYAEACKRATTNQGLDPMVERLREEGLGFEVEQTGGFTMVIVVSVNNTDQGTYGITCDGEDPERPWLLAWYEGRAWEFSEEETDAWHDLTMDEVVTRVVSDL